MRRLFRFGVAVAAICSVAAMPALSSARTLHFRDTAGVPWAQQAIQQMAQEGVLYGTAPGVFDPDGVLTRAQMATALGRLKGWNAAQPGSNQRLQGFHDWSSVPGWAAPYMAIAVEHGVLQGFPGGYVRPQAQLSWAELAVIVARAFNYPSVPQGQVPGLLGQLVNGAGTPTWAQPAVAEDVQAGDFGGILVQLYQPNAQVTRAELALFLDQAASGQKPTQPQPAAVSQLSLSPNPIAAAGSLQAGQSVTVTVYATDGNGQAVANGTVYLSLAQAAGGGSASAGGTALTSTPQALTTDAQGTVQVTYTAPTTLPGGGTDTLTAAGAAGNAGVTATDSYTFAAGQPQPAAVSQLSLSPNPIAAAGSLQAGQSVTVTVYATDGNGQAVANGTVYLSLAQAAGGGSASAGGTALTSTPQAFTTDAQGTLQVTYTAPTTLPGGGTDTLTAAGAAGNPGVTATDSYTFAAGQPANTVSGTLEGMSLTMQVGGQTVSYPLAPGVTVTDNGQPGTLADLGANQSLTLTLNSAGRVTHIDITSPSEGTTSSNS